MRRYLTHAEQVKRTYSETTLKKENTRECTDKKLWAKVKTADKVLEMYNKGELRAPLVRLQCIDFDTEFYQELVLASEQFWARSNRPRPLPPSSAKRRRVEKDDDEDEEDELKDDDEGEVPMEISEDEEADSEDSDAVDPPTAGTSTGVPPSTAEASEAPATPTRNPIPESVSLSSSVSTRQTRSATQRRSTGSGLKLRIPGGRSPGRAATKDTEEEREVEEELSSGSDDDDLYLDPE